MLKCKGQLNQSILANFAQLTFDQAKDLLVVDPRIDDFGERSHASPDHLFYHAIPVSSLLADVSVGGIQSGDLQQRKQVLIEDCHLLSSICLLDNVKHPQIVLFFEGFHSDISVETERIYLQNTFNTVGKNDRFHDFSEFFLVKFSSVLHHSMNQTETFVEGNIFELVEEEPYQIGC